MNSSTACSVPSSPSCWSASHGELEHTPDTQGGGGHWTCRKDQLVHCKVSLEMSYTTVYLPSDAIAPLHAHTVGSGYQAHTACTYCRIGLSGTHCYLVHTAY